MTNDAEDPCHHKAPWCEERHHCQIQRAECCIRTAEGAPKDRQRIEDLEKKEREEGKEEE